MNDNKRHDYAWFKSIVTALGLHLQERTKVADKIVIWACGHTSKHPQIRDESEGAPLMAMFAYGPDEDHMEMGGTLFFEREYRAGSLLLPVTEDVMRQNCAIAAENSLGNRGVGAN
jgi:hypothetical protein